MARRDAHAEAARLAAPTPTEKELTRRQGRFVAWCSDYGLSALPADPRTVGWYLTAHAEDWVFGTLKNARYAIGRLHRDAGLDDPTATPLVVTLMKALHRQKRNEPTALVDPLTTPLLAELCRLDTAARGAVHEAVVLRCQIAAIVARDHDVAPSRLVRVRGHDLDGHGGPAMMVPGRRNHDGTDGDPTHLVVDPQRDPWGLGARLVRLKEIVPAVAADAPFCVKRNATNGTHLAADDVAAATLAQQLAQAAARAGVTRSGPLGRWLKDLTEAEFVRLLVHCDRYAWTDQRNRTLVATSFALALRPCEARGLERHLVTGHPYGVTVTFRRAKKKDPEAVVTKLVGHLPDCPPHCPACLLAAWLEDGGVRRGALFPSRLRDGTGTQMTDGALKYAVRSMVERGGIDAHVSPKSARSGVVTSLTAAGAETEDITDLTDHTTPDVLRRHYVLTNEGARHHLGEGSHRQVPQRAVGGRLDPSDVDPQGLDRAVVGLLGDLVE